MAPRIKNIPTKMENQKEFRAWWLETPTTIERLRLIYNNTVAPVLHLPREEQFTKYVFRRITDYYTGRCEELFEPINHIVSSLSYRVRRKSNGNYYHLCPDCTRNVLDELVGSPVVIDRTIHTVQPWPTMIGMLTVVEMWCAKCTIPLFKWYTDNDCLVCWPSD